MSFNIPEISQVHFLISFMSNLKPCGRLFLICNFDSYLLVIFMNRFIAKEQVFFCLIKDEISKLSSTALK